MRNHVVVGMMVLAVILFVYAQTTQASESEPTVQFTSAPPYSASYSTPAQFELVQQLGGSLEAVAVQGSYAFLGEGPRIKVLDITPGDDQKPRMVLIGQSEILPDTVREIVVGNGYAFALAGGLVVLDIHDLSHPILLSNLPDVEGKSLHLDDSQLYVVDIYRHWTVFDVSHPESPTLIADYLDVGEYSAVHFSGPYAYATAGSADGPEIRILEMGDPETLAEMGSITFSEYPLKELVLKYLDSEGAFVYVVGHRSCPGFWTCSHLLVINVSDPTNPTLRGSTPIGRYAYGATDLVVEDGNAYVVEADELNANLYIYDLSDPDNLQRVSQYSSWEHHFPKTVSVSGNHVYVYYSSSRWGEVVRSLESYLVSKNDEEIVITHSAKYEDDGRPYDVQFAGSQAYIIADRGVSVFDINNPLAPEQQGFIRTPNTTRSVKIVGDLMYVIWARLDPDYIDDMEYYLSIVDISDLEHPQTVYNGWFASSTPYGVPDFSVTSSRIYMTQWDWRDDPTDPSGVRRVLELTIFDAIDVAKLERVGEHEYPDTAKFHHFTDRYALIENEGLQILDVTDPMNPTVVSSPTVDGYIQQTITYGDVVYVLTRQSETSFLDYRLYVFDVTELAQPIQKAVYYQQNAVRSIEVDQGDFYVTGERQVQQLAIDSEGLLNSRGVFVISPRPPGNAHRVTRISDIFYVMDGGNGWFVLRYIPDIWLPLVQR